MKSPSGASMVVQWHDAYLLLAPKSASISSSQSPFSTTSRMADSAMSVGAFKHDNTQPPPSERVMPLFSLKGRTAIVSGAGAGIGLAVAQGFAEAGANVAIWYNSNKKAIERAQEIEKTYGVKGQWTKVYRYWTLN